MAASLALAVWCMETSRPSQGAVELALQANKRVTHAAHAYTEYNSCMGFMQREEDPKIQGCS